MTGQDSQPHRSSLATFIKRVFQRPDRTKVADGTVQFLRSWHLQIFSTSARCTAKEHPKYAFRYGWQFTALSSLLHFIPLGTVLALVTLNLRNTWIGPVPANIITALQFVAKLLEVLIQTSLAALVLDLVHKQALKHQGLPLGAFLAPYHLSSISYLWSLEFWGFITSKCVRGRKKVFLISFIVTAIVLAALAGPASAVALIPRLLVQRESHTLVLISEPDDQYPDKIDLKNRQLNNADTLRYVLSMLSYHQQSARDIQANSSTQVAFMDDQGSRVLSSVSAYYNNTYMISSVVPSQLSAYVLDQYNTRSDLLYLSTMVEGISQMRQPLVRQTCTRNNAYFMDNSSYITFSTDQSELNALVRVQDIWPGSIRNVSSSGVRLLNLPTRSFFADSSSQLNYTSQISIVDTTTAPSNVSTAYTELTQEISTKNNMSWLSTTIYGCTLSAAWTEVETVIEYPSASVSVKNQKNQETWFHNSEISIASAWMQKLIQSSVEANSQDFAYSQDPQRLSDLVALALSMATVTSSQLKDQLGPLYFWDQNVQGASQDTVYQRGTLSSAYAAFTYVQEQKPFKTFDQLTIYPSANNETQPSSFMQFDCSYHKRSYGYGTAEMTVKLSLAVLCLYITMTVTYIVYMNISGYCSVAWNTIGEVVLLALHSSSPDNLDGTTAGVETLATYDASVNLRCRTGYPGSAALVIDRPCDNDGNDKSEYSQLIANKKY